MLERSITCACLIRYLILILLNNNNNKVNYTGGIWPEKVQDVVAVTIESYIMISNDLKWPLDVAATISATASANPSKKQPESMHLL